MVRNSEFLRASPTFVIDRQLIQPARIWSSEVVSLHRSALQRNPVLLLQKSPRIQLFSYLSCPQPLRPPNSPAMSWGNTPSRPGASCLSLVFIEEMALIDCCQVGVFAGR
jgi:hypothetical protein